MYSAHWEGSVTEAKHLASPLVTAYIPSTLPAHPPPLADWEFLLSSFLLKPKAVHNFDTVCVDTDMYVVYNHQCPIRNSSFSAFFS